MEEFNKVNTAVLSDEVKEVGETTFFKEKSIITPSMGSLDTYKKENHTYSPQELIRINVFRYIESLEPTTRYQISKETGISYTSVRSIVRDLVFSGVVHEDIRLGDNGKTYKVLTIPKENKEECE